jgi:hypothetical protein
MRTIGDDIIVIDGVLYTDMNFDPSLLSNDPNAISVHAKSDVHFGVIRKPKKMEPGGYYLIYEEFLKEHPSGIKDVIGFSNI